MEKTLKFLLVLSIVSLCFSCERSDKPDSSKISLRMPSSDSIQSLVSSQKLQGTAPNSMAEINCFAVMVTGPEAELHRNVCYQEASPLTATRYPVGLYRVGIKPGEEISIYVPAGLDRVVSLVGFRALEGNCFDWRAANFNPDINVSPGYVLGTVGALNLEPGGVKEVPMKLSLDSNKWFDRCVGPDFTDDSGATTPSMSPILSIKKSVWPQQYMVKSTVAPCIEFELSLRDANGDLLYVPKEKTLTANFSGYGLDASLAPVGGQSGLKIFSSAASCATNSSDYISQVVFDSNSSKKSLFVYGGSNLSSASYFSLTAKTPVTSMIAATSGHWQNEVKLDSQISYEISTVPSAVRNGCYKGVMNVKSLDGASQTDSGMVFNVTSGISVYSGANCTGVLTGFSGSTKTFYFKIDVAALATQMITISGTGISNSAKIEIAPGLPAPVGLKVLGYNTVPVSAGCGPDSQLRVILVNGMGSAVPSVSGSEINFQVNYPTSYFALRADGCGNSTVASGANFILNGGTTESLFYYQPGATVFSGLITLQPNQSLPQTTFNLSIY